MSTGFAGCFEHPRRCSVLRDRRRKHSAARASVDLENCTRPIWVIKAARAPRAHGPSHRQDSKGTRWMPWHQESMKDVDGCDKPRLGAEQPFDPRISEWGNPAPVMRRHPAMNT